MIITLRQHINRPNQILFCLLLTICKSNSILSIIKPQYPYSNQLSINTNHLQQQLQYRQAKSARAGIFHMQIQTRTSTAPRQSFVPSTTVVRPVPLQTQTQTPTDKNDLNPRHLFTTGPENVQFNKALRSHLESIYYFKQQQNKQYVDRIGNAAEDLGLKRSPNNARDRAQLDYILGYIMQFPSESVATAHESANKLGYYDTAEHETQLKQYFKNKQPHLYAKSVMEGKKICKCCGFYSQTRQIDTFYSIKDLNNVGPEILLYFQYLKILIVYLAFFFLVFGVYCLMRNIVYSLIYRKQMNEAIIDDYFMTYYLPTMFGRGSFNFYKTQYNSLYTVVEYLLGVAVFAIWVLLAKKNKIQHAFEEKEFDKDHIEIEDYTLFFPGLLKTTTPDQLTKQLVPVANRKYEQLRQEKEINYDILRTQPIRVQKINFIVPYYFETKDFAQLEEYKKLVKEQQKLKQQIVKWLQYRKQNQQFNLPQAQREKTYLQLKDLRGRKQKLATQMKQKRQVFYREESLKHDYQNAYVTFGHTYNKQLIERLKIGINQISSGSKQSDEWGSEAKITTALAPEDIKWNNFGQSALKRVCKGLLLIIVNFLIIYLTFNIILILSDRKIVLARQNQANIKVGEPLTSQLKFRLIGALISISGSLIIIIVNKILEAIILKFTEMERNISHTEDELSIAIKTTVAVFLNSAIVPMMIAYYVKKGNMFGMDGLADQVFYFALISMVTGPLLKIINISYIINLIKRRLLASPWRRLSKQMTQKQYNELYQYERMSIGVWYSESAAIFMFTCFYASMQPIIILFTTINLVCCYLTSKYCLFNWTRRPDPRNRRINQFMGEIAYMSLFLFGLGYPLWAQGEFKGNRFVTLIFVAFMLSMMVALLVLVQNKKKVSSQVERILEENNFKQIRAGRYNIDRLFFRTEYDRKNPATKQEAIKKFKQFYKKAKTQKMSDEMRKQLEYNIENGFGSGYGYGYGEGQIGLWGSNDEEMVNYVFEDDDQFEDIYDDDEDDRYGGYGGYDNGGYGGYPGFAGAKVGGRLFDDNDSDDDREYINQANLHYAGNQYNSYQPTRVPTNNAIPNYYAYGNAYSPNINYQPAVSNTYQSHMRRPNNPGHQPYRR